MGSKGEELRKNRLFWVLYRKGYHNVFRRKLGFYIFNEKDYEDCMRAYSNPHQHFWAKISSWNFAHPFATKRDVQEVLKDYFDYFNEQQEYFRIHSFQGDTIMVMTDTVARVLDDVHAKSGFTNKQQDN